MTALTTPSTTTDAIQIRIEGQPAPKGSRNVGRTKTGRTYTYAASKFEKPWVDAVMAATHAVMRRHAQPPPPYRIDVQILIEWTPKKVNPWPSLHDLDKLMRAVIDGLVFGKAMTDDRHIVEIHARKRYARAGESSGAIVSLAHIEP